MKRLIAAQETWKISMNMAIRKDFTPNGVGLPFYVQGLPGPLAWNRLVPRFFIQKSMKYESCPECNKPWNENEIEFQVCDLCGYENPDSLAGIKIRSKKIFRSALGWGIVAIGTAICISLYHFLAHDVTIVGYWITFFISSLFLILLTRKLR